VILQSFAHDANILLELLEGVPEAEIPSKFLCMYKLSSLCPKRVQFDCVCTGAKSELGAPRERQLFPLHHTEGKAPIHLSPIISDATLSRLSRHGIRSIQTNTVIPFPRVYITEAFPDGTGGRIYYCRVGGTILSRGCRSAGFP
jgi:hypothetical protein